MDNFQYAINHIRLNLNLLGLTHALYKKTDYSNVPSTNFAHKHVASSSAQSLTSFASTVSHSLLNYNTKQDYSSYSNDQGKLRFNCVWTDTASAASDLSTGLGKDPKTTLPSIKTSSISNITPTTVPNNLALILSEMSELIDQNAEMLRRNELLNAQVQRLTQAQSYCLNYIHQQSPSQSLTASDGTKVDIKNSQDWIMHSLPLTTQGIANATMADMERFIWNEEALELVIKRNLNYDFTSAASVQGPLLKKQDHISRPQKSPQAQQVDPPTPTRDNKKGKHTKSAGQSNDGHIMGLFTKDIPLK
jgi:hypothetical protein